MFNNNIAAVHPALMTKAKEAAEQIRKIREREVTTSFVVSSSGDSVSVTKQVETLPHPQKK